MCKPQKGAVGIYSSPAFGKIRFKVTRVEGDIAHVTYDAPMGRSSQFIWRFKDGLNTLHTWTGKTVPCGDPKCFAKRKAR